MRDRHSLKTRPWSPCAQHALCCAVVYFCNSWSLLRALWFGSCSNQILWYTYCKAIVNTVLWAAGLKRKGRFKTTIKTGDMLMGAAAVHATHATAQVEPGSGPRPVAITLQAACVGVILDAPMQA